MIGAQALSEGTWCPINALTPRKWTRCPLTTFRVQTASSVGIAVNVLLLCLVAESDPVSQEGAPQPHDEETEEVDREYAGGCQAGLVECDPAEQEQG